MKTVRWILIGSRIFALTCGLTVLGSGCGDSSTTSGPAGVTQEENKRNEDTRKAMEEYAKQAREEAKKKR
jgi:hypothetical protein